MGVWRLMKSSPFSHITVPTQAFLAVNSNDPADGHSAADHAPDPIALLGNYGQIFARPCPKKNISGEFGPRHGFVHSRPVKDIEQLTSLFREAMEVDDECE